MGYDMKKAVIAGLCVLTALMVFAPSASACTIFSAADGDTVLFGNNEDWLEKDTYIWFVPQSEGEYGRACVGFENAHPQGGVNDQGLAIDWVAYKDALPENLAPELPGKQNVQGDINDVLLGTCATVDDLIAFYQHHNDPNLGYATLLAADRSGAVVSVSWDKAAGDIAVNRTEGKMRSVGYGARVVGERFVRDSAVTPEAFRGLLEAAVQTDMTLYSNIFDLNTGDITLYCGSGFDESVHLNLHEELQKGAHILYIPSLFKTEAQAGSDVLSPETLLPLYLRIIIYALGLFCLLYIVFSALSLARCKNPTTLKISLRCVAMAAGVAAIVLLALLYYRWYFVINYSFAILGVFAAVLSWAFLALVIAHLTLCIAVLIQRRMTKGAGTVHIAASVLMLLMAVEFLISGFMGV